MRKQLLDLIQGTVLFQYRLPNSEIWIPKTSISTLSDHCFSGSDPEAISNVIYNAILDYSFNEKDLEIDSKSFQGMHSSALMTKLRYDPDDSEDGKLKYGFFWETLLHVLLRLYFWTETLISRGFFYNPLEKSETKGYDSYHLIELEWRQPELWFWEAKFHITSTNWIASAMKWMTKALSDDYFLKNLIALSNFKNSFNKQSAVIRGILESQEKQWYFTLAEEVRKHSIKLIYPVLIAYEETSSWYDNSIKSAVDYIQQNHANFKPALSYDFELFFIFLPLRGVKQIKSLVIQWIWEKKPILSE